MAPQNRNKTLEEEKVEESTEKNGESAVKEETLMAENDDVEAKHPAASTAKQSPPTMTTEETKKKESFMQTAGSKALRPFVIISSSYLLFTVTDGAIRMIVLLHAYNKNFSALEVAIMFTLYELAGVFTNLAAGVMGARWGIKFTLICGLTLQLIAYALLFGWQDEWSKQQAIIYVTFAQMFCGCCQRSDQTRWQDSYQACDAGRTEHKTVQTGVLDHRMEEFLERCWIFPG